MVIWKILIQVYFLVNINNNHWTTAFYNDKNGQPINNYTINLISITNNENELENNKIK